MCEKHYKKWRRAQTELPPVPTRRNACSVDDCTGDAWGHGYCRKHYERWQRTGSTDLLPVRSLDQRLAEDINYDGPLPEHMPDAGPCWLWGGTRDKWGYGKITIRQVKQSVHRVVYRELVGPIPDGLTLDHLCRNPPCCNPDHMEPVTNAENVRRMRAWHRERRANAGHGGHPAAHASAGR